MVATVEGEVEISVDVAVVNRSDGDRPGGGDGDLCLLTVGVRLGVLGGGLFHRLRSGARPNGVGASGGRRGVGGSIAEDEGEELRALRLFARAGG